MNPKKPRTLVGSSASLALAGMLLSSVNAGEIERIDLKNFGDYDPDLGEFVTVYDRDVSGGTLGAISYGEIRWDNLKAEAPGIIVYNNTPVHEPGQIIADCVMAPRIDADRQCNDASQTDARYKMSATAVGPIDMVFRVKLLDANAVILDADGFLIAADQDVSRNLYRMIGMLSNDTGQRLGGFTVQVGFGLGADFYKSRAGDGLKLGLHREGATDADNLKDDEIAEFPDDLFYGPADAGHDWGFFSSSRAGFAVDTAALASEEDFFGSIGISSNYSGLFGKWLPLTLVPQGLFYDPDGDPVTDAAVTAWYDGTRWIRYVVDEITGVRTETYPDAVQIAEWEATPPSVYADDGVWTEGDSLTAGGILYAIWDAAAGVYVLADGITRVTNDEMTARIAAAPDELERRPGYFMGPIEDLANLNLNYFIEVANPSAWPTYANGEATFTLRITPLNESVTALPAHASETPPPSSRAGCAVGGDGRLDPTLLAMLAAALGFMGWRRRSAK
jgi:hypothetical protein